MIRLLFLVSLVLKIEKDYTFGFEYNLTQNFTIGISSERGNATTIRFNYKNNPKVAKPAYKYKESNHKETDDKYVKFIRNLNNNNIGVNKIIESSEAIGIELTQFVHPNLNIIDEIIRKASIDAGIKKEIKTELRGCRS